MNEEIFEKYKKFKEKFELPRFSDLERAFRIEINTDGKVIDAVRGEISDRIFNFSERILEPIFNYPEALCCFFEQDMITKAEKERLFGLYKKIQALKWENNYLTIHPNDKKTAEWINKAWELWNKELHSELVNICKKFSSGWSVMKFSDEKTYYHG